MFYKIRLILDVAVSRRPNIDALRIGRGSIYQSGPRSGKYAMLFHNNEEVDNFLEEYVNKPWQQFTTNINLDNSRHVKPILVCLRIIHNFFNEVYKKLIPS